MLQLKQSSMIQSLRYKALALSETETETEYAIRALSLQKTDVAIFAIHHPRTVSFLLHKTRNMETSLSYSERALALPESKF